MTKSVYPFPEEVYAEQLRQFWHETMVELQQEILADLEAEKNQTQHAA